MKGKFSSVSWVRDPVVHLGVNVSSSPIIVSAWSMAVTLWQQFKYNYYHGGILIIKLILYYCIAYIVS